jgi:hypothetical protein
LEHLNIGNCPLISDVNALATCRDLVYLDCRGCPLLVDLSALVAACPKFNL